MKTTAGNKTLWLWGSGVEGAIQMALYWYDGYQPYEIFLKRNWKCHWPFSVFAKQREWASVHVSRSQSAFLWLLHYETTPPPAAPTMGERGVGYPMSPRVFRLFGQRLKVVNRGNFFLWNPESRFYWQGIRNPSLYGQEIRNPVLGMWKLQTGIQNPRLSWITLRGLIGDTFYNKSSPNFDMLA